MFEFMLFRDLSDFFTKNDHVWIYGHGLEFVLAIDRFKRVLSSLAHAVQRSDTSHATEPMRNRLMIMHSMSKLQKTLFQALFD